MSTKVTFAQPDGMQQVASGESGRSVMQVAVDAGVRGIVGECMGEMSCATCHVYVAEALPFRSMSVDEDDLLEAVDGRRDNSRLSCQLILKADMGDVVVEVPQ